jgi:hypothetical protein
MRRLTVAEPANVLVKDPVGARRVLASLKSNIYSSVFAAELYASRAPNDVSFDNVCVPVY